MIWEKNPYTEANVAMRPQNGSWLVIFSDVLALLLTFFVLLFSMNAVQMDDWKAVVDALSDRLNPARAQVQEKVDLENYSARIDLPQAMHLGYLKRILEAKLTGDSDLSGVVLIREPDRLVIRFSEPEATRRPEFTGVEGTLDEEVRQFAAALGDMLGPISNEISIAGFMPATTVAGRDGISRWHMSLGRAAEFAEILRSADFRGPLSVYGYGYAARDAAFQANTMIELEPDDQVYDIEVIIHSASARGVNVGF